MPKALGVKQILTACQMSFEGVANREIADKLGATEATISNWRKSEIWQEFEAELIEAYKQRLLSFQEEIATTPQD